MQITTYSSFKKRPNSTKQPTSGTTVTVTLKDKTSIEAPTFILSGGVSSYENVTAVKWGDRYYFVSDITSDHNGITEISCTLDRLATFKSDIGSAYCFIERCAWGYNEGITDTATSTIDETYTKGSVSDAIFPSTPDKGYVAMQIASSNTATIVGGGAEIAFLEPDLNTPTEPNTYAVLAKLWDGSVSTSIKNTMADAWSAIIRAVYIPCFTYSDLTGTGFVTNDLYFGTTNYSDVQIKTYSATTGPVCYTHTYEFDLESMMEYPTFKWRNLPPFCDWFLYLPFYGPVDIEGDMFIQHGLVHPYLLVKVCVDYVTGDLTYLLYYRVYTGLTPHDALIARYQTRIGIDIPLSNIRQGNALETIGSALSAVGNLATGNVGAAIGDGVAGIISSARSQVSSIGNISNGIGIAQAEFDTSAPKIRLYCKGHKTNEEPNSHINSIGCPLMAQDQISLHTGYIKCSNASVEIPGTQADKDAVNAMLNSGFFYE